MYSLLLQQPSLTKLGQALSLSTKVHWILVLATLVSENKLQTMEDAGNLHKTLTGPQSGRREASDRRKPSMEAEISEALFDVLQYTAIPYTVIQCEL